MAGEAIVAIRIAACCAIQSLDKLQHQTSGVIMLTSTLLIEKEPTMGELRGGSWGGKGLLLLPEEVLLEGCKVTLALWSWLGGGWAPCKSNEALREWKERGGNGGAVVVMTVLSDDCCSLLLVADKVRLSRLKLLALTGPLSGRLANGWATVCSYDINQYNQTLI